ncbi:hypothetical protein KAH81_03600, partial [bacterium]|nr:hypothetical protein [bacterium]
MRIKVLFIGVLALALLVTSGFSAELIKYPVGADTELGIGTVVKLSGENTVEACGVGEEAIGVIIGYEGSGVTREYLLSFSGIVDNVRLAEDIVLVDIGEKLMPASSGRVKLIDDPPTGSVVGIVLETGFAGDRVRIIVNIEYSSGAGAQNLSEVLGEGNSTGGLTITNDVGDVTVDDNLYITGNLDLDGNVTDGNWLGDEIQDAYVADNVTSGRIQNYASAPLTSRLGEVYYNTSDNGTYIYTTSGWDDYEGPEGPAG